MKANVVREKPTIDGTPGTLTLENGWSCDTLELPWHNNERGRSCTLADTYHAKLGHSPHLGGPKHQVYRLEDKHGRADVLIHNANFAGEVDAGEETQLHGCTAVGRGYGEIMNNKKVLQMGIYNSVKTLEELIQQTGGEDLEITYSWAEGCEPEGGASADQA